MDFSHIPVMLEEVLSYLKPAEGKIIIDGTLGGAGHSKEILPRLGETGLLIGIDQDKTAIEVATKRLSEVGNNYKIYQTNYQAFDCCLADLGIRGIDGLLLDLGVSSFQLDTKERGFSFQQNAPLDMRMNREGVLTAKTLVNSSSEAELAEIILKYGEERWAKRIAKFIVESRKTSPIKATGELVEIILKAVPKGARQEGLHPATRTFQALRIAVNNELGVLSETLKKVVHFLNPGGRVVILSFHSLEDRLVKQNFLDNARGCICPPEFPVCNCGGQPLYKILTKKPIVAPLKEITRNPRARSAKLRAAEKI